MPLWTISDPIGALTRNVPVTVFDAESLSDGEESIALAVPPRTGRAVNITFTILFGSAPSTVDYLLQDAINNVDAEFYDIVGSNMTATGGGKITVANVNGRFVRVKAVDADTQTVTAQIMVS